nr:MAG TPA: hypothetical protein [Caudoviricetes sp.]
MSPGRQRKSSRFNQVIVFSYLVTLGYIVSYTQQTIGITIFLTIFYVVCNYVTNFL